jgi:MscS family membrane protein
LSYCLLARLVARTKTTVENRIIRATKRLTFLAVLLASLHTVSPSLGLPYSSEIYVVLYYALLVTVTVIAVRVAAIILDEVFVKIGIPAEKKNMVVKVVKFGIIALGFIGILSDYFNVVMPFFLSLGIIGFALIFSLQYPLANLIGWVYIVASNVFKVGDRIKIGESYGVVSSINYLTTKVTEVSEYGMLSEGS